MPTATWSSAGGPEFEFPAASIYERFEDACRRTMAGLAVQRPELEESEAELELRATAGPEFDDEDESVIATFAPDTPPTWAGTFGLGVPGRAVMARPAG